MKCGGYTSLFYELEGGKFDPATERKLREINMVNRGNAYPKSSEEINQEASEAKRVENIKNNLETFEEFGEANNQADLQERENKRKRDLLDEISKIVYEEINSINKDKILKIIEKNRGIRIRESDIDVNDPGCILFSAGPSHFFFYGQQALHCLFGC